MRGLVGVLKDGWIFAMQLGQTRRENFESLEVYEKIPKNNSALNKNVIFHGRRIICPDQKYLPHF